MRYRAATCDFADFVNFSTNSVDFRKSTPTIPPRGHPETGHPRPANSWIKKQRATPPGEAAMPKHPPEARDLGHYFSLAQVGLEMVVPVGAGVLLDNHFGWQPWGVVVGAVLGLATGLTHLAALSRRRNRHEAGRRPTGTAPDEPRQEPP